MAQSPDQPMNASPPAKAVKFIVVCGGVISGIGKGVIASSTGLLMKAFGLRVTAIKIDPYLNIDAGTMSPLDHGTWLDGAVRMSSFISLLFR
jgi:hypothetical protein